MILSRIKGLILPAICCLMTTGMSCCDGGDSSADKDMYNETSDTLSRLLGSVSGFDILYRMEMDSAVIASSFGWENFINGLEVTLGDRHPIAYVSGTTMGLKIAEDLESFGQYGVKVDRETILNEIRRSVDEKRPVDQRAQNELSALYSTLTDSLRNLKGNTVPGPLADSILSVYSRLTGITIGNDIHDFNTNENKTFDTDQFFNGLGNVVNHSGGSDFLAGVYEASMLSMRIAALETKGVKIRPQTVLETMKAVFKSRKCDEKRYNEATDSLQDIILRIDRANRREENARLTSSDKAIQNIKTGEALVAKMKKNTPEAKTTASGLTYIISNMGIGNPIGDSDSVKVSYSGARLDGKVFDADTAAVMVPAQSMPGLREGLRMLRPGGKAKFWIPGELAYEGFGMPRLGIGPMETVVFEIDILEVRR